VARRERLIFNGEPGDTYTNDTGRVLYQLIVNWHFSCGLCAQYDHAIGPSWPIPFHRNCRCHQLALWPGMESQPYVDFRAKINELDHREQGKVVGRSNLILIENGVVQWSDVVTRTRIRELREVVSIKKLDTKTMANVGVEPQIAEQAYASVHTSAHQFAEETRRRLVEAILAKGVERDKLRQVVSERLAARVTISMGPSGPGSLPVTPTDLTPPPTPPSPKPATTPSPKPKPKPKPPTPAQPAPAQVEAAYIKALNLSKPAPQPPAPAVRIPEGMNRDLVLKSLAVADKYQVPVEVEGHAYLAANYGTERVKNIHAAFDAGIGKIFLNEKSSYWTDPQAALERWQKSGFVSTAAEDHTIVHEVGHALHHRSVGRDGLQTLRMQTFSDKQKEFIRKAISWYAAANPAEFVAEVFAGLVAGKQYDNVVMRYYDKIKGPRP
jgi:hypothetical protein